MLLRIWMQWYGAIPKWEIRLSFKNEVGENINAMHELILLQKWHNPWGRLWLYSQRLHKVLKILSKTFSPHTLGCMTVMPSQPSKDLWQLDEGVCNKSANTGSNEKKITVYLQYLAGRGFPDEPAQKKFCGLLLEKSWMCQANIIWYHRQLKTSDLISYSVSKLTRWQINLLNLCVSNGKGRHLLGM